MFNADNNSKGSLTVSDLKKYPVVIIEKDLNGKRLLRSRPSNNNHIVVNGNVGPAFSPVVILSDLRECQRKVKCQKTTLENGESHLNPNDTANHKSDQVNFLNLLDLTPRLPASPATVVTNHMCGPELETNKYGKIDKSKQLQCCLTSTFGQKFIENHLITNHLECVLKYEKFCFSSIRRLVNGDTAVRDVPLCGYDVTFIPKRGTSCHKYCFNSAQKSERIKTINTGLNKRGRTLRAQCKTLKIVLKRLRSTEIERWTCSQKRNTVREVVNVVDSQDDIAAKSQTNCFLGKSQPPSKALTLNSFPGKSKQPPKPQSTNSFAGKSKQPLVDTNKMPNRCLSMYLRSPLRNGSPQRQTYDQVRQSDAMEKNILSRNGFVPDKDISSDSDSDVEFICCKVRSPEKPLQPAFKTAESKIVEMDDCIASNPINIDGLPNHKLLDLVNSVIFKCQICHYQTPSDKNSVLGRLQEHMKHVHRRWKEVMALYKVEFDRQQQSYVMVVEAYATDHLLIEP